MVFELEQIAGFGDPVFRLNGVSYAARFEVSELKADARFRVLDPKARIAPPENSAQPLQNPPCLQKIQSSFFMSRAGWCLPSFRAHLPGPIRTKR
jgi:hypothetical protein